MTRRGVIGKKSEKPRTDHYHFRCSPDFKRILDKVIEVRKEDCHELWSGADVLHMALVKLAKEIGVKDVPEKL